MGVPRRVGATVLVASVVASLRTANGMARPCTAA